MVRIHLSMQEIQVQSLGWEGTQEKGMATHSSILAWEIPWTEEPHGLQSMGHKYLDMTEELTHTHKLSIYSLVGVVLGAKQNLIMNK